MTAMLNIKDLKAYYGQVQALHGLEFGLNEGSLTTLLGANGAGKTTTLRAICNMVRSTGSIEFEGAPLTGRSTENIVRLGIAHVPQGRGTFTTMTVEENLQLGAITRKDKAGVLSDIERMYDHFPVLKERHTQQAGTLSGGEQQMLAVARALMLRPRLMLLPKSRTTKTSVNPIWDTEEPVMELLINQVLAGIATGAIYACMALAVVMIYQAIDHLNFAQGEMAMFSTFISWQLMQWGLPYWWAFLLTLIFSFAGGIAIERLLFKPLAKAPVLTNVAGFIALFAIINSVAGLTWDFTIKQYPTPFGSAPFLGSQLISTHQAGMIGVTIGLLILLYLFFQFTRIGLAMRAAASLPESARLVGINTSWMIALGWGMAAAIGSIAGMLIAPVVFLEPNMMGGVLIYGFAAAVLGGLTSPLGAVVGGFLVGVFENLAGTYIPGVGNELKLPIALALIITVLVVKPAGLFGRPIVKRV